MMAGSAVATEMPLPINSGGSIATKVGAKVAAAALVEISFVQTTV